MREISEWVLRLLGLRRSPSVAFAIAGSATTGLSAAPGEEAASSNSASDKSPKIENEDDDLDKLAVKIATLFGTLPVEIRDPVSRGRANPVIWSSISERPSVHDLMRLSAKDFENYREVVRLTERWQALKGTAAQS
jgi:hypothetical protein